MDELPRRRTCATMDVHRRLLRTDPEYRRNREAIERFARAYLRHTLRSGLRQGPVRIPVVVHVVWNTPAQNVTDAQIQSQIDVLNRDYRRLNTDANLVPAAFQPVAADARLEFALAARDPNCNPTNGITRRQTNVVSFGPNDAVKFTAQGGTDAWPRDRYLNIWVCSLAGGLLGYAQFPGGAANTDGVVIDFQAFGTVGTAQAPFNLGRTATHEIGHWVNLLHIWGDDGGLCTGSDMVADTPNQADARAGCPAFPSVSCNNGPNGDMWMNYMDYTDDACMYLFTAGQAARMDAALYGPRAAILGSDGFIPPASPGAPDLWSQDLNVDVGAEPDTATTIMWLSDDIWVRKQNDGFTNQEHQNPEYREPGFGSNYVYVRLRNRSCNTAGSGTVKLYWAKASSALGWPAPFDGSVTQPALMGGFIGQQQTGSIAAGGFVILEFPWYPPNPADYASFGADKAHFCLLSRIETSASAPFGMTFPETGNLYDNVRNNNNIVWKNITVVDEFPGAGRFAWLGVAYADALPAKLLFTAPKEARRSVFDWGGVRVSLGRRLFELWERGGRVGDGVEPGRRYDILLRRSGASIGNLKLEPKAFHTIRLQFEAKDERERANEVLLLDVTQLSPEGKKERVVGGVRLVLKLVALVDEEKGERPVLSFDGAQWVPERPPVPLAEELAEAEVAEAR